MGRLRDITAALLGRSAYQAPPSDMMALDSPEVERLRELMGGQLALQSMSQTRWYLDDLERAERMADAGQIEVAARLMRAARRDGVLSGVLSTRTGGLVRLPKRFSGDPDVTSALEVGHASTRSVFDEIFPPTELALLAADGVLLGVGLGELVPVAGREYPVFVRLDPEFLVYRWVENRWYYRSIAGLLPIVPGDGRWILHTPGGRMSPWQHGQWKAIGRAFIRKEHAALHKDNWEAKLANPARVAVSPTGAGEQQKESWFRAVMAWGVNTVFGMSPGYDVKLVESNGRGFESFNKTIADQNQEMIIAIAGQTVTVEGGKGFSTTDVHKSIRADLIKETADALAYTLNTQGIPSFIAVRFGVEAVEQRPCVLEWDVTPPKDLNSEATAHATATNAITLLRDALAAEGQRLDVATLCRRYAIPVLGDSDGDGKADTAPAAAPARASASLRVVPATQSSADDDDGDDDDGDDDEHEVA